MVAVIKPRRASRFVEISSSREVLGAMDYACRTRCPVKVTGMPGTGKTTALQHHAKQYSAVYCQVGESQKGARGLYQMLLAAYGRPVHAGTTGELANSVYTNMVISWDVQPLIVDEYQTLEPAIVRELLNVQETLEIPLILAGNGETLVRRKSDTKALLQIADRVDFEVEVGGMTAEDCELVAIEYGVEGNDAFQAARNYGLQTNVRQLVRLIEHAQMLAGDGQHVEELYTREQPAVRYEHLEAALLVKRGRKEALHLFSSPKAAAS